MSLPGLAAVVLAAGEGSRLNSGRPKVLHEIAGQALIRHVIAALRFHQILGRSADVKRRIARQRRFLANALGAEYCSQGVAHAQCARPLSAASSLS